MENLYHALVEIYGEKEGDDIFWKWFHYSAENFIEYLLNDPYSPSVLILKNFVWVITIDGHDYWSAIHSKLRMINV